jgi:hypothetical protein
LRNTVSLYHLIKPAKLRACLCATADIVDASAIEALEAVAAVARRLHRLFDDNNDRERLDYVLLAVRVRSELAPHVRRRAQWSDRR